MKQARDLFLLAAIAYRQGKYSDAGTLFATAISSDDADEFLNVLNEENTVTSGTLRSNSRSIVDNISTAAESFSLGLNELDADEDSFNQPTSGLGIEDDEDVELDEDNGDDPSRTLIGQPILPSSISSQEESSSQKEKPRKIIISQSLHSPIKVKSK